ncbi:MULTISPECIES: prolyl oligopeptidase family serine peptidase [unclassified Erwinia]|uniref:prolyl oligopeptidase family serine peptidase n=1 Tax=unclassified Erwinia TaxID=2622719 RepID=UPI001F53AF08|nr:MULTISPECIES: prolyl oligopeptidase family serine peptidase [unclassified Erwinia]
MQKNFQDLLSALEKPHDEDALRWVAEQNRHTVARFARGKRFEQMQHSILQSLNDQNNIPWCDHYHDTLYNFWQDDCHPRGIWRRTTLTSYLTAEPEWETVLDIDRLNDEESASWCYHGAELLYPDFSRALVFLSSGGDACQIREFDLISLTFVRDGFFLPESKSAVSWLDKNTLLLALDAGGDTVTTSGYPRCVRRWQRGESPQEARLIYSGKTSDICVDACHDHTAGFEKTVIHCSLDSQRSNAYLLTADDRLELIAIPPDATCDFVRNWLLISLTTDWQIADKTYPAGALLATDFVAFQQGQRDFSLLFTPDMHTTLQDYSATQDYLILNLTQDVVGRVEILKVENGRWRCVQKRALADFTSIFAAAIDTESNRYQLVTYSFLQPCSLSYGDFDNNSLTLIRQDPAYFDNADFDVSQHFARSRDGTQIPYFQIASKALALTGDHPTLLYGYGGFGESLTPHYLGSRGCTWLQRGGVYVVANIRGGGEYGPAWHLAAVKQHRHRAYEDFAAVATDLVQRRVTCAARLAAQGGSNGGLLIGNMLTDYPELFAALLCEVPLLDMTHYHLWLAGASWIAEYGDPEIAEERQWLQRYSPFDNVSGKRRYPPVLFTTGTQDDRVSPAHARKMVARMQQLGHRNVWLYEQHSAGHSNATENSQIAFDYALTEAFLWQMLTG